MGEYYTRYFINSAGSLWSGQAFVRDWSDFSWAKSYEPTPPSGYHKIAYPDTRTEYSAVIKKTQTVDTVEGELNNTFAKSNTISLGSVVSGNLSSENDIDAYILDIPDSGKLTVSFGMVPTSGIGTSSRFGLG